jgi:hypothetical protein
VRVSQHLELDELLFDSNSFHVTSRPLRPRIVFPPRDLLEGARQELESFGESLDLIEIHRAKVCRHFCQRIVGAVVLDVFFHDSPGSFPNSRSAGDFMRFKTKS